MSQTYNQLLHFANDFNELTEGGKCKIQKIMSSPVAITFQLRIPGKNLFLSLGRGEKYIGVWLDEQLPPSRQRIRDRFLEYLRSYLKNTTLTRIDVDEKDRCFSLFYTGRISGKIAFFLKGNELYFCNKFIHNSKTMIYLSWRKGTFEDDSEDLYSFFDGVGRREIEKSEIFEKCYFPDIQTEKKVRVGKSKKTINRKVLRINNDIKRVGVYRELEKVVEVEKILFNSLELMKSARIRPRKDESYYQLRNRVYQKIKSLKKGELILLTRLEKTLNEKSLLSTESNENGELRSVIQPVWSRQDTRKVSEVLDYKVFDISENVRIGLGLSAKGNDQLRKNFAAKEDFWFHTSEGTSPHVVLKGTDSNNLTQYFSRIASLIASHTEISVGTYIELIYTQVKNLKSIKGSPGLVKYSKIKYLRVLVEEIEIFP